MRPDRRQRQAALVAPGEETAARPGIGPARVRVADVGGEEFDVAPGGLVAGVGDQRRDQVPSGSGVVKATDVAEMSAGSWSVGRSSGGSRGSQFRGHDPCSTTNCMITSFIIRKIDGRGDAMIRTKHVHPPAPSPPPHGRLWCRWRVGS